MQALERIFGKRIAARACRLFTPPRSPYSPTAEPNGRILEGAAVGQFYATTGGDGPRQAPA